VGVVGGTTGVQSSPDGLTHVFTPVQEIRSGETIRFQVRLLAQQIGAPRIELSAISAAAAVPSSDVLDIEITP
jgi:hypothetical protein